MYYLGIDLGGTNIAAGVVDENYNIIGKSNVKTNLPKTAEEIADSMAKAARLALADSGHSIDEMEWLGVGTPGTANFYTGIVEYSNNLRFHNVPLKAYMEERLGLTTYIQNDANAAAYGEALAGAAKGHRHAIMITLGTGVGGGIIIDGKIYSGFNCAGAELGHTVIVKDGKPCTCGRNGCVESYVSATGLINMTKEAMQENKGSLMWEISNKEGKVSGRTAFAAMKAGDSAGKKVVDEFISYLGCSLANFVNIFQPEVLVIGGGISREGETLLAPLREILHNEAYCCNTEKRTQLVVAKLGSDAGIIGAAMLGNLSEIL